MSKLIGKILVNVIPQQHLWKIKLFSYWETLIGNMKGKVRIEQITENSLILGVCHATWAQELFLLSPMLKKKINTHLKEERIKQIKFRTTKFNASKQLSSEEKKTHYFNQHNKPCPSEHCLTIPEHSILESMENEELAAELEKFYVRCKKNKIS